MSEKTDALRRLQSLDTKLKMVEGDKLYRNYDVQKKQNHIQQKKGELSQSGEEIKTFYKKISGKELDLKSLEADIDKLRLQMNQLKTNKEFGATKLEIGGKEANKSVIEDDILKLMTAYEEMQKKHKISESEIKQEELQLEELKKKVDADLETVESEIAELKEKRAVSEVGLDKDVLQQYQRLVSHKDAVAVVGVVNKVCQGCYMSITSQTLNKLMTDRDLTFCHSCGRILYLDNGKEG